MLFSIMARKQIKVSRRMLFTWFMLGGFIFLIAPQNWTNKFQFAFARIFSLPLSISRNISLSVRARQLPSDVVGRREYNQLQNHLANLIEELNQERQKVRKLSGLRDRIALSGVRFVLADVITDSMGGLQSELIINRGKDDGVAEGQFVLGDNSIVGAVSAVSSRTAQIRLITDPASNIAVKIAESNVSRIMQGGGNNSAKVRMLSIKHKVRVGDNIYACKKPGFLGAPVIVGKVDKCKRDDENPSLWDVTVKPVCETGMLNDVAVIVMNPQQ